MLVRLRTFKPRPIPRLAENAPRHLLSMHILAPAALLLNAPIVFRKYKFGAQIRSLKSVPMPERVSYILSRLFSAAFTPSLKTIDPPPRPPTPHKTQADLHIVPISPTRIPT